MKTQKQEKRDDLTIVYDALQHQVIMTRLLLKEQEKKEKPDEGMIRFCEAKLSAYEEMYLFIDLVKTDRYHKKSEHPF